MGTETYLAQVNVLYLFDVTVKLNNPLMGTETRLVQTYVYYSHDIMLN